MTSDLNTDLSRLTGARQTMLSWSRVVDSFESMPEVFKNSYLLALGELQPFPYVVFAPCMAGLRRKVTEKLLVETSDSM